MSHWLTGFLIAVAPLLLLVLLLLLGRYPGEQAIERFHRAFRQFFEREAATSSCDLRPAFICASVRGGRLIASSMAGRAPPRFI